MIQSSKEIKRAPIVGFVRYSQKIAFGSNKVARDVFESEYFEYRYNIFVNVTLKSFQQQTNTDFVLLLLHSENMPIIYQERFSELEKSNSFLYNVFVEDTNESFNKSLRSSRDYTTSNNEAVITFRIDNDDAVQNDFIQNLSGFVKNEFIGFCVSIPMLYRVQHISEQIYLLEELYFPANAIGLAYVTNKSKYKTVLELGNHDLVNNLSGMVVLPKFYNGGLMTINGKNEINSIDSTRARLLNEVEIESFLNERNIPGINLNCLRVLKIKKLFLFKKVIILLTPPVLHSIITKLRSLI